MDYNGDGILDILSGSWPGELYFFQGEGQGQFAAGQKIKDKNGKLIKPDNATTAFYADWNGDGVNDLLLGSIEGHVYLCRNEGSAQQPAFTPPAKITHDGKTLKTDSDSHPIAGDWDSDGKIDLLVGSGDGSVQWYRNVGSAVVPKLTTGGVLLAASTLMQSMERRSDGCGIRAKICVTDWNHDGRKDLLVGDFHMTMTKQPKLTKAQQAERLRLREQISAAQREMQPFHAEMSKAGRAPTNQADYALWKKKREAARRKYQASLDKSMKLSRSYQKYEPSYQQNGFVWLLLAGSEQVAHSR